MALSFFRALDPTSKNSGIVYFRISDGPCQGTEMLDSSVFENICDAFDSDLDFFAGLLTTYNIFIGNHYDFYLNGYSNSKGGAKGVLDYLIFPLIARKLIADTYLDERKDNDFSNTLALMIAIPLELIRFSAAVALTLLLAPIVALIHLIDACLPEYNEENTPVASNMTT